MTNPTITLTTDFGDNSPYVAAMKGVILSIHPAASIVDLSHQISPQDLQSTAFFLANSIPFFPAGVVHVVVVDPGVGTNRAILHVTAGRHQLLVPDNGCWTFMASRESPSCRVIHVTDSSYWRNPPSNTFHGRDIFAPVAAWLSRGMNPELLGPSASNWVQLHLPSWRETANGVEGEVVYIDHFGNLISNLPATAWQKAGVEVVGIQIQSQSVPLVSCYAEAPPASLVSLVSSSGYLEVAETQGNAAQRLKAGVGTPVRVLFKPSPAT